MNRFLILTKTHTPDSDALNVAARVTPAQVRRALAHQWDLLAVISLLVSCGAYGLYAITQMTGF